MCVALGRPSNAAGTSLAVRTMLVVGMPGIVEGASSAEAFAQIVEEGLEVGHGEKRRVFALDSGSHGGAETVFDDALDAAAPDEAIDGIANGEASAGRERDEPLATVAGASLAADEAELVQRLEHAADDRWGDAELAVNGALGERRAGGFAKDVEEIESRGGQSERDEWFAGDAEASPVGAFESEEGGVHGERESTGCAEREGGREAMRGPAWGAGALARADPQKCLNSIAS